MAAARNLRLRSDRVYNGCRRCGGIARGARRLERRMAAIHGRNPTNHCFLRPSGEPFTLSSVGSLVVV